jgi:hypothetical protein
VRAGSISLLLLVVLSVVGVSQAGDVHLVQLGPSALSGAVLAEIPSRLEPLRALLEDTTLGPQRKPGQDGWTPAQFARFTAGSLAERGYPVWVAANSVRTWVLVGVECAGQVVWIPVEPTPRVGEVQGTLGRIPFATSGGSSLLLDEGYLSFTSVAPLGDNSAPVCGFSVSALEMDQGSTLQLNASTSFDRDGAIALFRWQVGDGPWVATTSWSHAIIVAASEIVPLTLVVVDNAGKSSQCTVSLSVRPMDQKTIRVAPPPCGCAGG